MSSLDITAPLNHRPTGVACATAAVVQIPTNAAKVYAVSFHKQIKNLINI